MRRSIVAAVVVLSLVAAATAYARYGANVWRWGCPSQDELERLRTRDEVVDAFADSGLGLMPTPLPRALRDVSTYQGAVLYRHSAQQGDLYVLVCRARCAVPGYLLNRDLPRRSRGRFRVGFNLGNNLSAWITGSDRRSSAQLESRALSALSKIDLGVDSDDRCYVG